MIQVTHFQIGLIAGFAAVAGISAIAGYWYGRKFPYREQYRILRGPSHSKHMEETQPW